MRKTFTLLACVIAVTAFADGGVAIPEDELTPMITAWGPEYIKIRDALLKKYKCSELDIGRYKHPAYHLAATILKQRSLNPRMFEKLEIPVRKYRNAKKMDMMRVNPSYFTQSLLSFLSYPNGVPQYKTELEAERRLAKELEKMGKHLEDGDPFVKERRCSVLEKVREENKRIEMAQKLKDAPDMPAVRAAILEFLWKFKRETAEYCCALHDYAETDFERSGCIIFLERILLAKEGLDRWRVPLSDKPPGCGDDLNFAWIAMDYLFNLDSMKTLPFTQLQFVPLHCRTYTGILLESLKRLKYGEAVPFLEYLAKDGKRDEKFIKALAATLDELKPLNRKPVKWKGLLVKWPPSTAPYATTGGAKKENAGKNDSNR